MNGTDRAVARVFPTDENTFWDKVVLDSESSIRGHNPNTVPATGGTPVATGVVGRLITTMLPAGAYYVELQGGTGGRGGNGGSSGTSSSNWSNSSGGAGGVATELLLVNPAPSDTIGNTPDGANGAVGLNGFSSNGGGGGGGGGGKTGRLSYCYIERIGLLIARGGRGGNGGNGADILNGLTAAQSGFAGQAGTAGESIVAGFVLESATVVTLFAGNNGGDGARGGNGGNSGSAAGARVGGTGGDGATEFAEASSGYARIFRAPL